MALNTQLTNLVVNGQADFITTQLANGFIDVMSGAQPVSGDTAIGAQVVLATLTFGATSFPAASAGVLTANAITAGTGTAGAGGGTAATWARLYKSDHTTKVLDCSVGTASANMILGAATIATGVAVTCSSLTFTTAKATAGS